MSQSAFEKNTHSENVLWEEIKIEAEGVINKVYGTDPRHGVMAKAIADKIAFGIGIPWRL